MNCNTCVCDSGPTLFCHVCDNFLPDPLTGPKAGLIRRWLAVALDHVIAITVFSVTTLSLIRGAAAQSSMAVLLSCAAVFGYAVAFFSSLALGMTPGKWLLNIRAVDKRNGLTPGFGKMLIRETVGKLVSEFFFGLGFFWAIWDRDSQAWHDKLAGTVVIRRDRMISRNYPSSKWPAMALLAFALTILSILVPRETRAIPVMAQATQPSRSVPTIQDGVVVENMRSTSPPRVDLDIPAKLAIDTSEEPVNQRSNTNSDSSTIEQPIEVQTQITQMLERWASAIASDDPSKTASFYTEVVQRYFLARNYSREQVQKDREAQSATGRRLLSFRFSEVRFEEMTSSSARITLTKSYEIESPGMALIDRRTHSRLWLMNTDAGWKITGEQDLFD